MEPYKTQDIVLAATLKVSGYNLVDIELHHTKGIFVFEDVTETVISEFDLGQCQVEPVEFNNTIKFLTTSVRRKLNR